MTNQKSLQLRHFVVTLRQQNPDMTLQQIATAVNRTRERVRQILVSEEMETRSAKRVESASRPTPLCRVCNTEIIRPPSRHRRAYCDECIRTKIWRVDMGLRKRRIPRIDVPCAYCTKIVNMRETLYKRNKAQKNFYCSKSCRSKGMWANQIVMNVDGRIKRFRLGWDRND